jgi:hypothetical protein
MLGEFKSRKLAGRLRRCQRVGDVERVCRALLGYRRSAAIYWRQGRRRAVWNCIQHG